MVNQQKGVQQETAYSAVVVNDHMYRRPSLYCKPRNVNAPFKLTKLTKR